MTVMSEQRNQALQQLEQLDPGSRLHTGSMGGAFWPPFSKLPGSSRAFEIDLKWLAEHDKWKEEHRDATLVEARKDDNVSAGEREAASVRLKQIDSI